MKILHITKKYPRALGGDAVVVANLEKQQRAAKHAVVIVTSNCDEIKSDKHVYKVGLKDAPHKLDTITVRRLVSLVILFFRMFMILRKERPNVIHTHSVDMAFFASFAARVYRIPIVHTFHIVTFYDSNQSLLRRRTELWLAARAGPYSVTAPNTYDVQQLRAAGMRQAMLLSNGVDITLWEPLGNVKKDKQVTAIAVGRLEQQKGYDYLIRAVALLDDKELIKVVIVGEGSQKAALRQLAREQGVAANILFVGRKSQDEVRALLEKAHIAVFASLYETTPLTLLEAWAAGIPVIATPVGILRNVPMDFSAATVVMAKDAPALASAMGRLAKSQHLRRSLLEAGHEEAKKYAWPVVARTLDVIYRSAAR